MVVTGEGINPHQVTRTYLVIRVVIAHAGRANQTIDCKGEDRGTQSTPERDIRMSAQIVAGPTATNGDLATLEDLQETGGMDGHVVEVRQEETIEMEGTLGTRETIGEGTMIFTGGDRRGVGPWWWWKGFLINVCSMVWRLWFQYHHGRTIP